VIGTQGDKSSTIKKKRHGSKDTDRKQKTNDNKQKRKSNTTK